MRTAARIRSVGVHVLPATALFIAGCGGDDVHLGVGANPPNVLVLTLDTTRADRLGCYGHAAAQTPHLDALAARGTRFEHAYSPVPLTLPAHTTLWTGLQPPEHSIHDNGRNALAPDVPHVAEALQRAGWSTGAFVSSAVLDAAFGLARGFDVYDDRMSAVDAEGDAEPPQRAGDATTDAAIAWLSTAREPFLAWVHYYDPHSTYEPPEPWKHRLKSPYDGEIAFMDDQIGRVLAALGERESLANTIVVVVADHGESLGEHGESTHGLFAYDATLRIPLIIAGASRTARVEETAVEMADIAPTIFELCGRGPWEGGRSLVPALQGAALAPRPIYGESEYGWLAFGWSPLHTVVSDGWRYIGSSEPELYEHARDPGEVVDLATGSAAPASAGQRARLERELAGMRAEFKPRGTSAAAVDEDLRARMSNLGYAQSTSTPGGSPSDWPSPRAMLTVYDDFSRGVGFAQHGQPERALPLLRRATEAWPRGALMHQQLGIALQLAARHADAIPPLTRALELDPSLEQSMYFRGLARTGTGEYEEAIADFDRAMKLRPEAYLPLVAKAWALVRVGREEEAAAAMRRVVATKPRDVAYAVSLARLLRNLSHDAESVAVLTRAQAENPEEIGLALYLAWELATNPNDAARDGARALQLAEKALKARSHGAQGDANPDELDTLAAAYAELGRFDEAVTVMDRLLRAAGTGADPELVAEWTARRAGYAEKRPFRDG